MQEYRASGKLKIAPAIDISVYPLRHFGKMGAMSKGCRKELYSRRDFKNPEIYTEEIIDFDGVKVIDIIGGASVPEIKQKLKWRILIFEYQKNYYEISFTARKSDFKKKKVQAGYKMIADTFEFTGKE